VIELIYSDSNSRFNIGVIFTPNYSFSERRHPVDNDDLSMIDFINLKIKLPRFFGGAHLSMMCVCIFIGVNTYMYIKIYIYTVFFLKYTSFVSGVDLLLTWFRARLIDLTSPRPTSWCPIKALRTLFSQKKIHIIQGFN
jgi:hypothetical protein